MGGEAEERLARRQEGGWGMEPAPGGCRCGCAPSRRPLPSPLLRTTNGTPWPNSSQLNATFCSRVSSHLPHVLRSQSSEEKGTGPGPLHGAVSAGSCSGSGDNSSALAIWATPQKESSSGGDLPVVSIKEYMG